MPLVPDHLPAILAIEQEVFRGLDPWSRMAFDAELVNPRALWRVAEDDDGTVAGYGGGWVIVDELHLLNLATAPGYRRRGVARAVIGELLAEAGRLGCRSATLEVRRGNEPARALYEAAGFRLEGVRKGYYLDGEDAMIYWKEGQKEGHL